MHVHTCTHNLLWYWVNVGELEKEEEQLHTCTCEYTCTHVHMIFCGTECVGDVKRNSKVKVYSWRKYELERGGR